MLSKYCILYKRAPAAVGVYGSPGTSRSWPARDDSFHFLTCVSFALIDLFHFSLLRLSSLLAPHRQRPHDLLMLPSPVLTHSRNSIQYLLKFE